MTLVVARQFADAPRLVADTQLTDPLGKRLNPYNRGALKLVILHRSLCIGFDGGEVMGRKAILDVGREAAISFNLAQVRRRLTLASRESSNGFIVACLSPSPSLIRIQDGVDEGEAPAAWLGDQPAFNAYQGYFATAESLPHEIQHSYQSHLDEVERSRASRMLPAMMQVIEDQRFGGVGGYRFAWRRPAEGSVTSRSPCLLLITSRRSTPRRMGECRLGNCRRGQLRLRRQDP